MAFFQGRGIAIEQPVPAAESAIGKKFYKSIDVAPTVAQFGIRRGIGVEAMHEKPLHAG